MFQPLLLAWPDQLLSRSVAALGGLPGVALVIRANRWLEAEQRILALARSHADAVLLLIHLRLLQGQVGSAEQLLCSGSLSSAQQQSAFGRYLQAQLWLQAGCGEPLRCKPAAFWEGEHQEPLLALAHCAHALCCGDHQAAAALLDLPVLQDCVEQIRLRARLLQAQSQLEAAIALLQPAAERAPQLLGLQQHLLNVLIDAGCFADALSQLRRALEHHGERPELLAQVVSLKLMQRQPGLARRAALLHRLKNMGHTNQPSIANQLITYEQTGHSDWLEHLQPVLLAEPADPNLLANLVMQLASVEAPSAAAVAERFCAQMAARNREMGIPPWSALHPNLSNGAPLRVVWLSGDIADHPVGRFLLGFFTASEGQLCHQHILVSWNDSRDNPFPGYFRDISGLEVLDVAGVRTPELVARVRQLQADVVVDLSGWTGKNFGNGLLARLAPLQVNYLGYFASTGNPGLDVWLGDAQLFPEPMREWHSEEIHRLPRCFIAWQPPAVLPEAQVPVPPPPTGPIRFGSFNHNRKFSDRALTLWGRILDAVPGSMLVLKATAAGDEATLALLQRRMQRCGLDPQRVIWLPLVGPSQEHLLQYGQLDVALDCLPNGGCTTTCEALWMGVPVITLTGTTYVSRMSTAVLHGAGLPEWCATSEAHYVQIAVAQADRLAELRRQRSSWRERLQASPLGDAAGLMQQIEQAFTSLVARRRQP